MMLLYEHLLVLGVPMIRLRRLLFRLSVTTVAYGLLCSFGAVLMEPDASEFVWYLMGCLWQGLPLYALVVGALLLGALGNPRAHGLKKLVEDDGSPTASRMNERGEPLVRGVSPTGRYPGQGDSWRDSWMDPF